MTDRKLLFEYNLQTFGEDKTEEATSKKLKDTREEGNVAKSQELAHGIELVAVFIMLRLFYSFVATRFLGIINWVYSAVIVDAVDTVRSGPDAHDTSVFLMTIILQIIIILAPFFIIGFVVAALSNGLQFQFKVTFKPLQPKLSKFNPISGFKRIFSKQSLVNLGLAIAKVVLISVIAYNTLVDHLKDLFLMYDLELNQSVSLACDLAVSTGLRISLVYLIVGVVDLIYQRQKFKKDNKMTKQEVKDEYKDAEGDPQIKGQIKQRMREASQRRMMQDVPQADVVITNPTRLAIAIKYDITVMGAPYVVAKGQGYMAQRIREIAEEHDIPVRRNKPLAWSLYSSVDVMEQIPTELYQAVAEILASLDDASKFINKDS